MSKFALGPGCSVQIGERPTPVEKTAQAELLAGLGAIFGEGEAACETILLGTPQSCAAVDDVCASLGLDSLSRDGFVVDKVPLCGEETLLLAAMHGRGVLYAVYTILEAMGTNYVLDPPVYPRLGHHVLTLPMKDEPAFGLRCASGVVCAKEDIPWYSRNRLNLLLVRLWGKEFEDLVQPAAEYGIELGVCGGDFTADEDNDQKAPVNPKTGHLLCAALDETWGYFEQLVTRRMDELDTCRAYSFRLTDFRPNPVFTRCQSCANIHPAQRILRALNIAREAASRKNGAVMFRTWGLDFMAEAYRHGSHQVTYGWDPDIHLRKVIEESSEDVMLVTKETWGDFMITYPPNHWIGLCKPHTQFVEYQVEPSEYRGNNTVPCSMVERWSRVMRLARDREVEGAWGCSWGTNLSIDEEAPVGELLNSLNTQAFTMLSWNPDVEVGEIYRRWAERIFPDCPMEMSEILRLSTEAVSRMMYVQGQRFNNHSGISGRLFHVEWCYHHYGFNDYGGTVTREMLDATKENLQRVMEEKDQCTDLVGRMLGILHEAKDKLRPVTYEGMQRMLEGMLGLARLWKEYARAFFLYGMLRTRWSDEKAEALRAACDMMTETAGELPDNSDLSRILWRGAESPSLVSNIRGSVKSLVADYEDFLLEAKRET